MIIIILCLLDKDINLHNQSNEDLEEFVQFHMSSQKQTANTKCIRFFNLSHRAQGLKILANCDGSGSTYDIYFDEQIVVDEVNWSNYMQMCMLNLCDN